MAKKAVKLKDNTINIKSQPVQAHIGASKYSNDGKVSFLECDK